MKPYRRRALLASLLLLARVVSAQDALAPDDGFSAGKYLHVLAGMSVGLAAASLTDGLTNVSSATGGQWVLPVVALAAAAVAGAGKELLDLTGFGDPRVTDILITAAGGLAAAASVVYIEGTFPPDRGGRVNADASLLVTAAMLALPVVQGLVRETERFVERQTAVRR